MYLLIILVVCLGLAFVVFGLWMLLPPPPLPSVGRLPGEAPQRPGWPLIAVIWTLITGFSALLGLMLSFGAHMLTALILFFIFWTPRSASEDWIIAAGSLSAGLIVCGLSVMLGQILVTGKYVRDSRPTLVVAVVATTLAILQGVAGASPRQDQQFETLTIGAIFITAVLSVSTWIQLLRTAPSPAPEAF
jgi:hypothetical protein